MEGARYLEDGRLTIFKRDGTFYARIRISPVGYIWRSLKTTDLETAIRVGRRLLFYLEQRAEQGLPLKSKLFSVVIYDYVRFRERDHHQGRTSDGMLRQIIRVAKFWREYAGAIPVEAIDDKVMREFVPWRRFDGPSRLYNFSTTATLESDHPWFLNVGGKMGLHRGIIAVTILSTVLAGAPAPAADSCSMWKQTCIASGPATDTPGNVRKCTDAAKVCLADCKKGQKYFVGPFNGQHHPVDSCS
jgi:hypothetical protein